MRAFECVCSTILQTPDTNASDIKCADCGRVYTHNGRFLWRESAGNSLPGSSEIVSGAVVLPDEDKRSKDQDAALEKAFVKGTLPEEDRRGDEVVLTETVPAAPAAVTEPARGSRKKN
jgi:hypothetical protein